MLSRHHRPALATLHNGKRDVISGNEISFILFRNRFAFISRSDSSSIADNILHWEARLHFLSFRGVGLKHTNITSVLATIVVSVESFVKPTTKKTPPCPPLKSVWRATKRCKRCINEVGVNMPTIALGNVNCAIGRTAATSVSAVNGNWKRPPKTPKNP